MLSINALAHRLRPCFDLYAMIEGENEGTNVL